MTCRCCECGLVDVPDQLRLVAVRAAAARDLDGDLFARAAALNPERQRDTCRHRRSTSILAWLVKSAPMSDAPEPKTGHLLMTAALIRRQAADLRATGPTDPELLRMAANHEMIAAVIKRLETKAAVRRDTTAPKQRRRFRVIEGGKG